MYSFAVSYTHLKWRKSDNYAGAIQERSHELMDKIRHKNKIKRLRVTTIAVAKLEER